MSHVALALALIGALSFASQWLAWRWRIPAIVLLLLVGIALGPASGLLDPDALLGDLLFPLVSLAVAIILFEGALTLRLDDIRGLAGVVRNLASVGMLITFAVLAAAAHYLIPLPLPIALVFGAVMVVTGPTVIAPLLRSLRPVLEVDRVLRWEGIIIDPIGAIFAVLMFEYVLLANADGAALHSVALVGGTLAAGIGIGLAAGLLCAQALRRDWLPHYLRKLGVLTLVLLAFAGSNYLQEESGLLTVTVMGLYLTNAPDLDIDDILAFKEDLTVILLSGIFILLAARVDLAGLWALGPPLLALLLVVQLVARPLSVLISTAGSPLAWRERALIAWIAPRGIVAAAVSSLFALKLEQAGLPDAEKLMPLCFAVILATVLLQSFTARPLGRLLGALRPAPRGVLLIGANPIARAIAAALQKLDIPVLLADPAWENCRLARMEGLNAYYGNPQSEHAENVLDLSGIRHVLALSPNRHLNAMATLHFANLFGESRVYSLRAPQDKSNQDSARFRARQILFGEQISFAKLNSLLSQGGSVRATTLTEAFGLDEYRHRHPQATPLLTLSPERRLTPVVGPLAELPPGTTLIALSPPEPASATTGSAADTAH